jgi:uncharacterized phage protein (predicted DNA packaging)
MVDVVVTELGPLLTLAEVKQHLKVDHAYDDMIIETYMEAAVRHVLMYCNLAYVPPGTEPQFKVAALMTVADFYDNRASVAPGPVVSVPIPANAASLINPYRMLRV